MRKLRVLMFIFCGSISILKSFGQTFEIKGGVNLSTMLSKDDRSNYSDQFSLTPRLLFGVTADIPLNQSFSIESGLFFSSKGYNLNKKKSLDPTSQFSPIYVKAILNYLEIPLLIKFSHSFFRLPFYGVIGPYGAIGINGKTISDMYPGGISDRKVYKHQMGSDELWKRYDYGLQAGAGIAFGKYVCGFNYSYGLANISQHSPHVEKNRVIGLTLGYKFKIKEPSP